MGSSGSQVDRYETAPSLYAHIARTLLEQIKMGDFRPGDRLPTERKLSQVMGVNRMTVRRALQVLEQQGLIIRRQGAGTYVAEPKIERQAAKLISFTKGMQRQGYETGARVVLFEAKRGETPSGSELGKFAFDLVYHIHRLRFINQEPVLLERLMIPVEYFPGFDHHDLSTRSLYEVMETEYDVKVVQARQSLEAVTTTEYEAELLEMELGAPLMLEKRLSLDQDDRPVEYGKDLYRGDRFRFITEMAQLDI